MALSILLRVDTQTVPKQPRDTETKRALFVIGSE